ncbi:hypothetical protein ACQKOF_05315 [Lysinibacillus sp. NPDC093190]|uniref:hypothetical protein n=1 Tax=Lysinibacillus sp. NPDC093190 TaxID=3390575 RepID=UPI003D055BEA
MFYPIGNTTIDSDKYREKFAKRYYLPFMKELIDLSGCSLKEAKELIDLLTTPTAKAVGVVRRGTRYLFS